MSAGLSLQELHRTLRHLRFARSWRRFCEQRVRALGDPPPEDGRWIRAHDEADAIVRTIERRLLHSWTETLPIRTVAEALPASKTYQRRWGAAEQELERGYVPRPGEMFPSNAGKRPHGDQDHDENGTTHQLAPRPDGAPRRAGSRAHRKRAVDAARG